MVEFKAPSADSVDAAATAKRRLIAALRASKFIGACLSKQQREKSPTLTSASCLETMAKIVRCLLARGHLVAQYLDAEQRKLLDAKDRRGVAEAVLLLCKLAAGRKIESADVVDVLTSSLRWFLGFGTEPTRPEIRTTVEVILSHSRLTVLCATRRH